MFATTRARVQARLLAASAFLLAVVALGALVGMLGPANRVEAAGRSAPAHSRRPPTARCTAPMHTGEPRSQHDRSA